MRSTSQGLTIWRKALESLVREKARSGTQRGISPSMELARVRCSLASMAFSSFCGGSMGTGSGKGPREGLCLRPPFVLLPTCPSLDPSPWPDPFLAGAQDEEGLNVLLLEVCVALTATARLHLIVPVQVLQRGPSDVDAAVPGQEGETWALPPCSHPHYLYCTPHSPGPAPSLHVVGQSHVIGPHIELPFPQAKDTTVHTPTVDAHAHVHVHTCHLTHQPGRRQLWLSSWQGLPHSQPRADLPLPSVPHRQGQTQMQQHIGWTWAENCLGLKDKCLRTVFTSRGSVASVELSYERKNNCSPCRPAQLALSLALIPLTLALPHPHRLESKVHRGLYTG